MKVETRLFLFMVIFFAIVTPIYGIVTYTMSGGHLEWIGTTVLALTMLTTAMVAGYLGVQGRKLDLRWEDNADAEIIDGTGALGFFPPSSIWPFWAALVAAIMLLGPVFGWWITLLGAGIGIWAVCGWCYEFYVGAYKH